MRSATNFFIIFTEIVILGAAIKAAYSLRCRSDDGPSEAELKRVIRSCMRKFGDANFAQNNQQQQQQQNQQQHTQQNRQKSRPGNRENYGYGGYDDSDEMNDGEIQDYGQYNGGNFNNNRQQNGYNRNGGGGSYSSSPSSSSYDSYDERRHNRGRYPGSYNNRTNNYGGGGGGQNQNNNWPYNYNNNQRNYPNSRGYNNNNYNNNNNNNNINKSRNNNNNGNNNQNNFSNDSACIVHCFFEEMHMLNNNNYPDRHKVMYILTKDMRDRELRNFYTDTIQECFQYLETQRRRDQCQFSRDLINCMTEYAKGNCDDWNEFNMVFN